MISRSIFLRFCSTIRPPRRSRFHLSLSLSPSPSLPLTLSLVSLFTLGGINSAIAVDEGRGMAVKRPGKNEGKSVPSHLVDINRHAALDSRTSRPVGNSGCKAREINRCHSSSSGRGFCLPLFFFLSLCFFFFLSLFFFYSLLHPLPSLFPRSFA